MKGLADYFGYDLKILATKAQVPFGDIELMLGRKVHWLDDPNQIWEQRHQFADRNFIIHTNWSFPGWLKYDKWMKKRGATIVVALDNTYNGSIRQWIGAIWFRFWLKRFFDAAFVPGRASYEYMLFLGMQPERIFTGYYGAYEGIYFPGKPINKRPNDFLFIGQLISRKGIDLLLDAYKEYRLKGGFYSLRIAGMGPFRNQCFGEGVIYEGHVQEPEQVADLMRGARFLLVPSRKDHWATVVCEAMACGTPVIATKYVGSTSDLLIDGVNGILVDELSKPELVKALFLAEQFNPDELSRAEVISIESAKNYQSNAYKNAFKKMLLDLRKENLENFI
jgi:glycosyltransferase involved in cell wall biosynthesis